MQLELKEYRTAKGEVLLYCGEPDMTRLEELSLSEGDLWHSGLQQGLRNAFSEVIYQSSVQFWYIKDFENLATCISWRCNPEAFVVRKSVWEQYGGFDDEYQNPLVAAFDFSYRLLRYLGGIPKHVDDLFPAVSYKNAAISTFDRYQFFKKNFKTSHSIFMLFRCGVWNPKELFAFWRTRKYQIRSIKEGIPARTLAAVDSYPTVSYIIPTMMRQDFTRNLLDDLSKQTVLPTEVIVIDATPNLDVDAAYPSEKYPFKLVAKAQQSKGSCRARNEAIELCTGEYIIFGDDDIRIPSTFVEAHLRFLKTYGAYACNGLDIRADHQQQDLTDLAQKLTKYEREFGKRAGATSCFSNANSCVLRSVVNQLGGNDVNFDGGYGEDSDFGFSITKLGISVLHNPFAVNLHLKPPQGGYRYWGLQAKKSGKARKTQPWELGKPVGRIKPVPSPTIMYGIVKQFSKVELREYKIKYMVHYLISGNKATLPFRILNLPYKFLQFKESLFYAKQLAARNTK